MLRPGELLDGKYRVEFLLGQGGMAAVWAGTNERTGKRVALKVVLPSLTATPGVDSLFQREGFAASRVDHPSVVTVFDIIKHRGMACIVMEQLTGETLDKLLERNGVLDVNEACALLLPAMRGVAAAHAQGVIHRDLKPQNIFVCMGPDGRAVTTKVLDFGISLMLGRAREPASGQGPNVLMGTPAYMAPEQIWGGAPIDERADVYGFGMLFYEALTGEVPFAGEPGPALFERILDDPPPSLAQLRPDLSPGLARIIATALAKSPGDRHATVDAMIVALEQEILSAAPRTGTPTPGSGLAIGLPLEVASGRRTTPVDGILRREPSEEHQATKFLAGFPLEAEAGHRRTSALTKLRRWLRPHRWPALASAGLLGLLAGTALVLGTRAGSGGQAPAHLPALAVRAGLPVRAEIVAPSAPVVVPTAPAAPVVAPTTPAAPAAENAEAPPAPSRATVRRRVVPRPGKPKASASSNQPRAGRLTAADF
jgi:serine/threonine-protein kinase